jgi:hypothetical protein
VEALRGYACTESGGEEEESECRELRAARALPYLFRRAQAHLRPRQEGAPQELALYVKPIFLGLSGQMGWLYSWEEE